MHTATALAALTPVVVSTCFSHYVHRKSRRAKPTKRLSYDEALHVIREFLRYASKFTVEDIQAFTSKPVHVPSWIFSESVLVPEKYLSSAADMVTDQLGPKGIELIGGKEWWKWRGPMGSLRAEFIEWRKDRKERLQDGEKGRNRVMFYVHGGAFFFGSVDTHRYQLERHSRSLKAQVFAPQYRLAPQFPFPCGLQDCLAAYLYLLDIYKSSEIILAGDSAGGGMVMSMLCTIRDRGLPLPAGGILISAWVDLTHSFPSVAENTALDYLPPTGFRNKPSRAWPPLSEDEMLTIRQNALQKRDASENHPETDILGEPPSVRAKEDSLSVVIDGQLAVVKGQIQMYATNRMLTHPLVSPVMQPSLGGLPPLFFLCGGGEMLRDEQIYIAHKAANPSSYPPKDAILDAYDPTREILNKYKPTYVQLQVWEGLCHAAPTFSWTHPAKHMYKAIAQFGAWALSRPQNLPIDILDECEGDGPDPTTPDERHSSQGQRIGKAGDPLPLFRNYMICQTVDQDCCVFPLDHSTVSPILQLPPAKVCALNPKLVKKWLAAQAAFDQKYTKTKRRVEKEILDELVRGYDTLGGESPPPAALVARRPVPGIMPQRTTWKNGGMLLWNRLVNRRNNDRDPSKEPEKDEVISDSGQASDSESDHHPAS